jgi:hypothetical protein
MKTVREIILEIKVLQASSQTLEPKVVLEQLLNLAEAVAELERDAPGDDAGDGDATDEMFDD